MTDIETLQERLRELQQPQIEIEALTAQIEEKRRTEAQERAQERNQRAEQALVSAQSQRRAELAELQELRAAIASQADMITRSVDEFSRAAQQLQEAFSRIVLQAIADQRAYNGIVYGDSESQEYVSPALEAILAGSDNEWAVPVPDVLNSRVSVPIAQVNSEPIALAQEIAQSLFSGANLPLPSIVVE